MGDSKHQKCLHVCVCRGFEAQDRYDVRWHIHAAEDENRTWLVWDQPVPIALLAETSRRLCRSLQVANCSSTSLKCSIQGNRNTEVVSCALFCLHPQEDLLQYEEIKIT